jgi:nickel transport system permease protein
MNAIKRFLSNKLAWVSLPLIGLILAMALFAPVIAPQRPDAVNLEARLLPPGPQHLLGTDHLGRDILSRLIWGARTSMGCVFLIIVLVVTLSTVVGSIAGYFGGWLDAAIMRACDIFLTFPTFILAMFLVAVLGTGLTNVVIAIVLTHWAWYARIVRGIVLGIKNREYVLAAKVSGTPGPLLVLRHFLPSVLSQVAILATLDIGHMMLHVSGLSFLGLGVRPPTAEWGVMISDAQQFVWTQPQLILYPGLMIFLAVLAFNLSGDAIRDNLDPSLRVGENA